MGITDTGGDLISLLQRLPTLNSMSVLTVFFLSMFRLAPIVSLAPFLGNRVPNPVKIGLVIALSTIMLPFMMLKLTTPIDFDKNFSALAIKELGIGMLLAFLISVPFWIAESAGTLIDFQRGSSALMVQDPSTQNQVSPIGLLYNYILIAFFYMLQGPFLFYEAILHSYAILPIDQFIPAYVFRPIGPLWNSLTYILSQILISTIQLAAPALLAILMTEMFLGIANRLAQQVQIAFLGMALKSIVGLSLLWAGWSVILTQLTKFTFHWITHIDHVLTQSIR